jgi:hypothetical protein
MRRSAWKDVALRFSLLSRHGASFPREPPGRLNHNSSSPFTAGGIDPNHLFAPGVTTNFPANGTRPICPYPQQTRYKGSGATNDAANFTCVYEQPVYTQNYFDPTWGRSR